MNKVLFILIFTFIVSRTSFAAHPLVIDDAGTQGKRKFQRELDGQQSYNNEDGVKSNMTQITPILMYGIVDNVDIILGGLIYSLSEYLVLDVGIKGGLNSAEDDITYLAGITWKF